MCSPFSAPCCISAWNVSIQGASLNFLSLLAEQANFAFFCHSIVTSVGCRKMLTFCIVVNSLEFQILQNLEYYILQWRLYIMPNLMQLVERNTCALSKQLLGEDLSQFITHNEHQETVAVDPHILHGIKPSCLKSNRLDLSK